MFRRTLSSYLTAAAIVAVAGAPLLAQSSGARPNPAGSSSGSSGGGSGRTASGSGGGGDAGSSGGSTSGSSSRPAAGSPAGPSGSNTDYAPARPERRAAPRDNSGQRPNSTNRNSAGAGEQERRAAPGTSATASSGDASGARRAVPTYARPRDGRPAVGTATERRPVVYGRNGENYYNPYYRYNSFYSRYPYGYYYAGYGLGLGHFYDPFLWGYYSPYAYGGYPGYYGGGGGGGGYYSRENSRDIGGLRLKVRPLEGQVYVDGYYVGEVDSFDGTFQKLQIEPGAHRVEIRADGFETVQFDVMVTPGETVTYKGDLKRIK